MHLLLGLVPLLDTFSIGHVSVGVGEDASKVIRSYGDVWRRMVLSR